MLDDIATANKTMVDLNLEKLEGEEFSLPAADGMAPFSLDVSDADDVDDDYDDEWDPAADAANFTIR